MNTIRKIVALNGVQETTTSAKIFVGGAKRVAVLLRRSDHDAGSTAFTIKGSLDYDEVTPTMTALNVWIDNVTNTNGQNLTRVAGKTLSANGDAFLWLDKNCLVNWIEITATETTDGTHSAWVLAEY